MDDKAADMVEELLVAAASIMEDASASILISDRATLETRVSVMRAAVIQIGQLADKAEALFNPSL